jgi:predicted RND superfamily exporter protein
MGIQTAAGEQDAGALLDALDAAFAPVADAGVEVVVTSNPVINHTIILALQDAQVSSLVTTLGAVMLLLVVSFWVRERRPALGVITTLPVVLALLWTFAMMAATGIPFGPITSTIAALAIGIGIPYAIHITNRFGEDRQRLPTAAAIRSTVRHTGGALAGSALTTCAGFGVLITSELTPFQQFGAVTVYAIGLALLAATLVLPSALALWDRWHRRHGDGATIGPATDADRMRRLAPARIATRRADER